MLGRFLGKSKECLRKLPGGFLEKVRKLKRKSKGTLEEHWKRKLKAK